MGQDIYIRVIARTGDGPWVEVPEGMFSGDGSDYSSAKSWYYGRDYSLFYILGGSRRSPLEGVTPISNRREIPMEYLRVLQESLPDVDGYYSDDFRSARRPNSPVLDELNIGEHTFGYATLRELQEFDWTRAEEVAGEDRFLLFRERTIHTLYRLAQRCWKHPECRGEDRSIVQDVKGINVDEALETMSKQCLGAEGVNLDNVVMLFGFDS